DSSDSKILTKELEEVKLEKDGLDGKLAGLLKALKNLDHLIESQRPSPTVVSTSAEGQNKDSSTSEDVASSNPPKPLSMGTPSTGSGNLYCQWELSPSSGNALRISYNHISHLLSNSQKEMDHQYPTVAKIHVLDTGKFEQWQFRIQQYLQHEHYALWEVIKVGDSYNVPTSIDPDDTTRRDVEQSGRTVTFTTKDMQKKKNDVKARTTLLLSLPDEHQLRTWPLFLPQRTAAMKMATLYVLPLLALPFPLVVLMLPQSVKTLLVPILLLSPVGNKMHKAFPLPGESSHLQYKFPLPVEGVPTARRIEIPLPGVCTAMMKKLPVKEKWQLH
nr:hypothetical protein [Tanacetum cinerariifolium]